MRTFAELVEEAGGAAKLAEASGVSRPHLANIAARRKRLTPDVMAAVRTHLPAVDEATWIALLLSPVSDESASPTPSEAA